MIFQITDDCEDLKITTKRGQIAYKGKRITEAPDFSSATLAARR